MNYITELLKPSLDEITQASIEEAIFRAYKDGLTDIAPMGFGGDSVLLYGEYGIPGQFRRSMVSIRNHCGNAELLITDYAGRFLFCGKLCIDVGVEQVAAYYFQTFQLVKAHIEATLPTTLAIGEIRWAPDATLSEGFKLLADAQAHRTQQGHAA